MLRFAITQAACVIVFTACSPARSDNSDAGATDGGLQCRYPQRLCGLACADTSANPRHCGGCDSPCSDGLLCSRGECVSDCSSDTLECAGGCIDPESNLLFCGASDDCAGPNAGVACVTDRATCSKGACQCGGADYLLWECDGICLDPAFNENHCGGCGRVCAAGPCIQEHCTKRVFMTDVTPAAFELSGLAGADELCNSLAQTLPSPFPFQAWLSDSQAGPMERFMTFSRAPYVNTIGETVARDWRELSSGSLWASVAYDQNGDPASPVVTPDDPQCSGFPLFWSNTAGAGTPYSTDPTFSCDDWTGAMPGSGASLGRADILNGWSSWCTGNVSCDERAHLLCVEQ